MISGLFETHLKVADLERSMHFYGEVLGLELGNVDWARRIAFYWLGGRGQAVLGLWEAPPEKVAPQHFAFRSTLEQMHQASAFLRDRGLPARNFLSDGRDAPTVHAWMPALSLYFRDPDGHSLEFIAMLDGEPRPELGVISWEAWQQVVGQT